MVANAYIELSGLDNVQQPLTSTNNICIIKNIHCKLHYLTVVVGCILHPAVHLYKVIYAI